MTSDRSRSTIEKLAIFRSCFIGLTHVYGTYDLQTGRARQEKKAVTDQVLLNHLLGRQPYGVYLLTGDRTRAVVADFDHEDVEPVRDFIQAAGRYGIPVYCERSKRKGWHGWIFADPAGVSAMKARLVIKAALDDVGHASTEVFPKQDRLSGNVAFGNYIYAPLFGALVPQGRTVFVDIANGMQPYPDQWSLLQCVQRVTERQLDEIIEINELATIQPPPTLTGDPPERTFGLPPCAQRMLANGVTRMQRSSFFRLAVRLKQTGLGQDYAIIVLKACAAKNKPSDGKRIITDQEILEQTASAYRNEYRGCGCEDEEVAPYCHPSCPVYRAKTGSIDPLRPGSCHRPARRN